VAYQVGVFANEVSICGPHSYWAFQGLRGCLEASGHVGVTGVSWMNEGLVLPSAQRQDVRVNTNPA
jgi:hypothetical protein